MPSIYDITFSNRVVELLPPDKRAPIMVAWFRALIIQLQYLHTFLFVDCRTGSTYPIWASFATYNKGDRVIHNESVYESLVGSNTANPQLLSHWRVYQKFFIGVEERVTYNIQKLVLEYALNKRFGTTFRQPPLVSDIYLTNNTPALSVFVIGGVEAISSAEFFDRSDEFIIDSYTLGNFYNYTINTPSTAFYTIDPDPVVCENIYRQFVDRYNPVGINYSIQPY